MHELSIVRELLKVAAERTPAGSRLRELHVAVGRLTGVSPDAMQFYFEALRDESLGPDVSLRVRLCPLRGRCALCHEVVTLEESRWLCPGCGEPTLTLENGDELDLESLVVEDGEADHDRAEDP